MSDENNPSRITRLLESEEDIDFSAETSSIPSISSSFDESSESNEGGGEFDTSLPAVHRYLGKLENVGGYTLYDDGQIIPSMLAIHTNTLVFPGFTLPLVLWDHETDQMLDDIRKGCIFALICTGKKKGHLYDYGVIMEVFETSTTSGTIKLKAKGRQRCEIIGRLPWIMGSRMQKLTVRILGEPSIKSPIANTQLQTLRARRTNFGNDSHQNVIRNYKYRRYHLSQYPQASWVYDHNEISYLLKLITQGLAKFYAKENLPRDPVSLSYWFVQNYQLTHDERLDILKCPSVYERLRLELEFLNTKRKLICKGCSIHIANQNDVFAMSRDGIQSNYCNPGGQVYETITVSDATNYVTVGNAQEEFSWFPGYAWTIIQCKSCENHLGWLFSSYNLQPQKFFGLAHSSLDIRIFKRELENV